MFNKITDKINSSFKKLRGNSVISSSNVEETLKEIRLSLLEADVNYKVVKELIAVSYTHLTLPTKRIV